MVKKNIYLVIFFGSLFSISLFSQGITGNIPRATNKGGMPKSNSLSAQNAPILLDAVYNFSWNLNIANWNSIPNGEKVSIEYDGNNNITGFTLKMWIDTAWVDTGQYIMTYNLNNNITSQVYKTSTGNSNWKNSSQYIYAYNSFNKLTSQLFQTWDIASSRWVDSSMYSYNYDANHNDTLLLFQSSPALIPQWSYHYSYDANNNPIRCMVQTWNGFEWINSRLYTSTYDANDNQTSSLLQTWNGAVWVNNMLNLYTFDVNKNNTSDLLQSWSGSFWVNFKYNSYTYDANNNQTGNLLQTWNALNWMNDSLETFTYNAGNKLTSNLIQIWKDSVWTNINEATYGYDANSNETEYLFQIWRNSSWARDTIKTYTYDANHLMLSSAVKSFNLTSNNLVTWGDSIYYYYAVEGINELHLHTASSIAYPNPSNGIFTIQSPVVIGNPDSYRESVEVYNVLGEKVYSQFTIHNLQFTIVLNDQPAGIYFYKILNKNGGITGNGKLVIQK
jgi:hypothetical protein